VLASGPTTDQRDCEAARIECVRRTPPIQAISRDRPPYDPKPTERCQVLKKTIQTPSGVTIASTVLMPTSRSTLGPGSACRASVGVSTVLPFSHFGMKSPCAPQPIGSGGIGSPGGRLTIWAVLSGRRETLRCGDRPPQSSSDLNPWSRNFESDNAGLAPTASQKKIAKPRDANGRRRRLPRVLPNIVKRNRGTPQKAGPGPEHVDALLRALTLRDIHRILSRR
jgi:hypothetical protein